MAIISHNRVSRYQEAKLNLQSLFKQTYQVAFGLAMVLLITAGRPSPFGLTITVVLGIAFVSWSETKRLRDNRIESDKELLRNIQIKQKELLKILLIKQQELLKILCKYELQSHTQASNLTSLIGEEPLKIAEMARFVLDENENFSQELDEIFEQFMNFVQDRYQRIEYEINSCLQKILSEKLEEKEMNDFIQLQNSLADRFQNLIEEELLLIEAVKLNLSRVNVP
jgi:hypothetical protein